VPTDLKSTELLVLAWTEHFFGADYLESKRFASPGGPMIGLEFTQDRNRLPEADAVWFHGPSILELPERRPDQIWILMSMESAVNYPMLRHPKLNEVFDLTMTYRLDSDIPCPYPNRRDYGSFLDPPTPHPGPSSGALAVYIASNPVDHRDRYVRELMRHIPIDSLGSCLNNRRLNDFVTGPDSWTRGGWDSILSVLPKYKFYLAFENSMTVDYVTERVFHALVCGVVPVYLGAPNVREFLPGDDAAIVATDFDSPADLADYLRHLDSDDEAYARHLRWKAAPLSDRFQRLVDLASVDPQHRMAVKIAHGCDRSCRCGGRMPGSL
jgi:alpha-1,3-fucosyltransferase 10